ncbi:hypothetical protein [Anaerorhabdus furcosa]|uniref:Lipoprotein n=1 Tax=Anaerorhabdus furcosa TaxID=118967 RepID=A0A1T4LLR2_9FIRM|nr:hypothetical protein [Anaerorhabdus furcosa]SJZ55662.1 hypothetical protein SAMN02745191_0956 [Anaerorhabdus furcosa]
MKKLIYVLVVGLLLVGCSTKAPNQNGESKKDGQNEQQEVELVFGKITSMTGNEIELDLAKDPTGEEQDLEENEDGSIKAATLTESANAEDNANQTNENEDKMKLEYTGEKLSVNVPAGIDISNFSSGSELKLTDLKEGSVIAVTRDKTTKALISISLIEK